MLAFFVVPIVLLLVALWEWLFSEKEVDFEMELMSHNYEEEDIN